MISKNVALAYHQGWKDSRILLVRLYREYIDCQKFDNNRDSKILLIEVVVKMGMDLSLMKIFSPKWWSSLYCFKTQLNCEWWFESCTNEETISLDNIRCTKPLEMSDCWERCWIDISCFGCRFPPSWRFYRPTLHSVEDHRELHPLLIHKYQN